MSTSGGSTKPSFRRLAASYFLLQGIAGVVWWGLMFSSPTVRGWFQGDEAGALLEQMVLADMTLFALGSLLAGGCLWRCSPAAAPVCWCVAGATLYATLVCLQGASTGEMHTLCFVVMIPACMLTLHSTMIGSARGGLPFREYRGQSGRTALRVAVVQTLVFYAVFFWGIPATILQAQRELGIASFTVTSLVLTGAVTGFIAGGVLAIGSTMQFAHRGQGTPLPTHAPRQLVVHGPYRFVRNPMAVGGIFQGVMVGVGLGSWPVMLYSLMGAVIWHVFVRPVEEADLADRFGEAYAAYRQRVRCWWPGMRAGENPE